MNPQHLRAFFWLQWRLRVNQFKKGGTLNLILFAILGVGALILSVVLFVSFLLLGMFAFDDADWQARGGASVPEILMYVWDGFIIAFLFAWMIGLVADLQRAEALALDRFLHLPVSLSGVFLLNYLSSLLSLTLIVFVPVMVGFALGLAIGRGPEMLLLFPLLAAFLLMVTAVSYQFQGWLASLMVNKRRRRTIVVAVTAAFVLLFQLPYFFNLIVSRPSMDPLGDAGARMRAEQAESKRALQAKEITVQEFQKRERQTLQRFREDIQQQRSASLERVQAAAWTLNTVLPPGWLAWGARQAAEGNGQYALLGMAGMGLIGAASLRRAYRTTLRLYTGQFSSKKRTARAEVAGPSAAGPTPEATVTARAGLKPGTTAGILELRLPWISEHAAAIAVAGFRSLVRAPEVKMLLLSPLAMILLFGFLFLRRGGDSDAAGEWAVFISPLMAAGAMTMVLLTMTQLAGNQFGFDRSGFRVFVLCPARRRDVLVGKNLALAPLALALGLFGLAFVQFAAPMRLDHLAAAVLQMISMYLLFSLLANCMAIMAPMAIASGTLRPSTTRMLPMILGIAVFFLMPLVIGPTLLPLAVEFMLEYAQITSGVPWALLLSVLLCAGVILLYRWLVGWQGVWLSSREQRILEIVAAKAE
jgi:ABC-2 type transport system permease protein